MKLSLDIYELGFVCFLYIWLESNRYAEWKEF